MGPLNFIVKEKKIVFFWFVSQRLDFNNRGKKLRIFFLPLVFTYCCCMFVVCWHFCLHFFGSVLIACRSFTTRLKQLFLCVFDKKESNSAYCVYRYNFYEYLKLSVEVLYLECHNNNFYFLFHLFVFCIEKLSKTT